MKRRSRLDATLIPENGVDRCYCGCKYWDEVESDIPPYSIWLCHDCDNPIEPALFDDGSYAITKTGRVLTESDFQDLAREAEGGYSLFPPRQAPDTPQERLNAQIDASYQAEINSLLAENARLREALEAAGVPSALVDRIAKGRPHTQALPEPPAAPDGRSKDGWGW